MGLGPRERRILKSIGQRLSGSDPRLASLLATFTRLTSVEEMPAREKIGPGGRWRRIWPRLFPRPGGAGRPLPGGDQPSALRQVGLAVWLVTAVGLIAIALAVSGGGARTGSCTGHPAPSCLGCSVDSAYRCGPRAHGIITTP
jgi:hypothetical protein